MKSILCSRKQPWVIFVACTTSEYFGNSKNGFWKFFSPAREISGSKTALSPCGSLSLPHEGQKSGLFVLWSTLPSLASEKRLLASNNVLDSIWVVLNTKSKFMVVLKVTCLLHCEQLLIREENFVLVPTANRVISRAKTNIRNVTNEPSLDERTFDIRSFRWICISTSHLPKLLGVKIYDETYF